LALFGMQVAPRSGIVLLSVRAERNVIWHFQQAFRADVFLMRTPVFRLTSTLKPSLASSSSDDVRASKIG
jgi:hypothetical protein